MSSDLQSKRAKLKAKQARLKFKQSRQGEPQLLRSNIGRPGELAVFSLLRRAGHKVSQRTYNAPFDLLVNDTIRVEVKTAQPTWNLGFPQWQFNIHRHGKVIESFTDLYILRMEGVPYFSNALHLLVEAPIGKPSVIVSLRSLLGRYAPNVAAFREFYMKGRGA